MTCPSVRTGVPCRETQANVARYEEESSPNARWPRWRAIEIGQRFGDRDLVAMAIHTEGLALIDVGEVPEGLALLDEAMTAVLAGDPARVFHPDHRLHLIQARLDLSDETRVSGANAVAARGRYALYRMASFPGMCRVNRAACSCLRGAWSEAEAEALLASEEMATLEPSLAAAALNQVGEVRRRTGDAQGAEAGVRPCTRTRRSIRSPVSPSFGWHREGRGGRRPGCA